MHHRTPRGDVIAIRAANDNRRWNRGCMAAIVINFAVWGSVLLVALFWAFHK